MSRRLLALAAVAVSAASATPADGQFPAITRKTTETQITWVETPADALAAARKSGKPILAYVTSAHCGYCRKMERETWAAPGVARLVGDRFVALRLHSDQHPEEVAALRVRAYPTTVIITPDGKAFAGRAGFVEPGQLTSQLLRPALEHKAVASRPAPAVN